MANSWSPYHSSTQPFATQNLETNSKGIWNFRIMLQYFLADERLQNSTSAEQRLKENIYREPWRLQMSERDKTIKQRINQSINLKNVILLQNIKLFDWLIVLGFTPNRQHSSHVTAGHFLHRSCVCFGVLRRTREFFTQMESLPLPVKGYKFWPNMLGTHGYVSVRVL